MIKYKCLECFIEFNELEKEAGLLHARFSHNNKAQLRVVEKDE